MTRIPLPGSNPAEPFQRGVESGTNLWQQLLGRGQQQQQMQQEWQQHLRNAAIREQQEKRLGALQPYMVAQYQQEAEMHPLKMDELKAKIKSEEEKAKLYSKGGNQRVSAAIQEADALFNGDREDPRWAQYVFNKNKQFMPNEKQLAQDEKLMASPEWEKMAPHLENAVDMNALPVASQQFYRKQMNEELQTIDKAKQVDHAIDQARELMKSNPGLYKKAINIIADPDKTPGMIEKSLTALLPEKEVEAFTTAAKLYADILTKQAQLNGMSRSVYALKLQQQAKAQVKNPDETNEQIFKNIKREIAPSLDREKALLYAMKHNQYLPYTKKYEIANGNDQDDFKTQNYALKEQNQLPGGPHSPTAMGMKKGFIDGQEIDVDPEDEEDFIKAGGKIL